MENSIIPNEVILSKIYLIRNQKVMLDRDLAELYQVKARRLREQVSRNLDRFPNHFMFQLDNKEINLMVSQNAIPSKSHLGGAKPYVFTEHGVLMLANVLKSEIALQMSIRIIETFVQMRELLLNHQELFAKIEQLEKRLGDQDEKIGQIFNYLRKFVQDQYTERKSIGFKLPE
jgi:phage regulator Rha-like protein